MDAKDIHGFDESVTDVQQHLVPSLYAFYSSCVAAGFSEEQALRLTQTWLGSVCGNSKGNT